MEALLAILFVTGLAAVVLVGSLLIETACRANMHDHSDREA